MMMLKIPECPAYLVDEKGLIYSTLTNQFIKQRKRKNGYMQVLLREGGKYKTILVHRAVMSAFHGSSDKFVNHKNGIKSDNRLENLEYVTPLENALHASSIGLLWRGSVELYNGTVDMWFPSQKVASDYTGLRQQEVSSLIKGVRKVAQGWKKTTHFYEIG